MLRMRTHKAAMATILFTATGTFVGQPLSASPVNRIGEILKDASLQDLQGQAINLLSFHTDDVLVITYTGVGCPIAGRYAPRLETLSQKYKAKGVRFVGINANPHDSLQDVAEDIKELGITFPMLKDDSQTLTAQLDAKTTTEVFVIDRTRTIRYRGMVDDQYALGTQRSRPKNKYLEIAIKDVLKGRTPFVARTAAPGCLITRGTSGAPSQRVTYSSHIARIVQNNCQPCHRKNQIGPFPLMTYDNVRGWSAMIYSVLEDHRMPPWNAPAKFDGLFMNERRMPESDEMQLLAWIDDGMPRGNPDEDPPARSWPKGWRIGKPDKIFSMKRAFKVPSDGTVEYQYFRIPTFFKENKWITAMEAKPGAADVVHHILVFVVDGKQKVDRSRIGLEDGFLCATVPGDTPSIFPPGAAKKLPAGATLVFQVHYTTNGKKRKDKSSVGMVFADGDAKQEVHTRGIHNLTFQVPAGASAHEVRAEYTLPENVKLLSLYPHMHTRGKDWTYVAHFPDGRTQELLSVPRYDFNWQESYILNEPIDLPKGTRVECIAHFDNSEANFANPDPTSPVRWGEQTWEEMMIGYIDYIPAR